MEGTPDIIEINGVEYSKDDLSIEAIKFYKSHQFVSARIRELENLNILLERAKNSYMMELKEELIAKKAGLLLDEDI